MKKRLICTIISLIMILSLSLVSGAVEKDVLDFDDLEVGTFGNYPGRLAVVDKGFGDLFTNEIIELEDGNKVLKMVHKANGEAYDTFLRYDFPSMPMQFVLEYDFNITLDEEKTTYESVWSDNAKTSDNRWVVPFDLYANGIFTCDELEIAKIEFGKWHKLSIVFDFVEKDLDVYIDETLALKDNYLQVLDEATGFQYYYIGENFKTNLGITTLLDNITFYEGSAPDWLETPGDDTTADDATTADEGTSDDLDPEPAISNGVDPVVIGVIAAAVVIIAAVVVILIKKKK